MRRVINGVPAVIIDVQRQPGANIVGTVDRIQQILPRLSAALPAGVKVEVAADRTGTIRASVTDVQFTLVLSVALVVLVVLLFLRTLSATIVAGVTLPLSLIASFGIMYFAGFSLDNLSLMALTIATGFVVDDAIVMIENIMRHIEHGDKPMDAAYKGAGEIGFTIISLTVSLIAVFIPLLFMTGIVGRLLPRIRPHADDCRFDVDGHRTDADTDDERALAARRQPWRAGARGTRRLTEAPLNALFVFYRVTLDVVLRYRTLTLIVAALTLVFTVTLYLAIPKGFLPDQDTGFLTADTEAVPGVSFERMNALQRTVEDTIRKDPGRAGRCYPWLGSARQTPHPTSPILPSP